MIFITGDCHADFSRFKKNVFFEQSELSKKDYVIIAGDFGGVWSRGEESQKEKFNLDFLESLPFTILFVDGNHENFDRLNSFPVQTWHGGNVHMVRPSVIHLMRGQVFEIDGIKLFAFGGWHPGTG